eukprot:TRINITY_DN5022_c0_g1_i4.p1 TRINITY_DN5022_c0_g1~~TRINITY_DN5022_c0_g1_i4.p1  ORF type:complete len:224 (+),score=-0.83 TRINITY_DN5022_c0_g1_i4:178-849(+)
MGILMKPTDESSDCHAGQPQFQPPGYEYPGAADPHGMYQPPPMNPPHRSDGFEGANDPNAYPRHPYSDQMPGGPMNAGPYGYPAGAPPGPPPYYPGAPHFPNAPVVDARVPLNPSVDSERFQMQRQSMEISQNPVVFQCPNCGHHGVTRATRSIGAGTYIAMGVLCLTFWPAVCCPLCCDCCKDTIHTCPSCNTLLAHSRYCHQRKNFNSNYCIISLFPCTLR